MKTEPDSDTEDTFGLLPNGIIEALTEDLTSENIKKEEYFTNIEPVELSEHYSLAPTPPIEPIVKEKNDLEIPSKRKRFDLNYIPTIYPCMECFKYLDSQENFNNHMLNVHVNHSNVVESERC